MDAFAGGVGLGNEFGGKFVVNFWTRVTEKRGGGGRLQGSFFGFVSELSRFVFLCTADGSWGHGVLLTHESTSPGVLWASTATRNRLWAWKKKNLVWW
jgi:hypothetical protein